MHIDWVTLVAQVVNFVILLVLLHRLLYRPIMRVISRREEEIEQRMEEAEEAKQEARERGQELREKRRELEERRAELLEEARQEVEERKEDLLEKARDEVQEARRRWRRALERDQEEFLDGLQDRAAEELRRILDEALDDLASTNLLEHMVPLFVEHLAELEDEERSRLRRGASGDDASVVLHISHELGSDQRDRLEEAVRQLLGDGREPELELDQDAQGGQAVHATEVDDVLIGRESIDAGEYEPGAIVELEPDQVR